MRRIAAGALASLALAAAPAAAAPHAVITGGPSSSVAETGATFTFTDSEAEPVLLQPAFECRLDAGAWGSCTSPRAYAGLGGGSHVFEVRAVSLFDDRTPATRSWTIEQQTVVEPPPLPPSQQPPPPNDEPTPKFAADGCPYGAAKPRQATLRQLRRATVCLLNHERAAHGLRRVRARRRLTAFAGGYAQTLVADRFFSHTTPGGLTFDDRVRASGYVRGRAWEVGEVLAWSPRRATPHREVLAWMASPPHRTVILTPAYRDVGVGIVPRPPRRGVRHGATYVAEFGHVG